MLRKVASFGASISDMKDIYKMFVRCALEYSSSVWHRSLTQDNISDLERVQKSALRIILGAKYTSYEEALCSLDLETLSDRREILFRRFAEQCLQVKQMETIVKKHDKIHNMTLRKTDKYKVTKSNTERFQMSAGIQIQNTLNEMS